MDKASGSNAIRAMLQAKCLTSVILPKSSRLELLVSDQDGYQQRSKVERFSNTFKQFRRIATRYENLTANSLAFVLLALIVIMLR